MPTDEQVREVAHAICKAAANVACVMDEHPEREPCTEANCSMMRIARDAIARVQREGPAFVYADEEH